MAIYSVHSKADPAHDAILVGDGFSAWAFLFTILWALLNRMWIVAAVLFAVLIGVAGFGRYFSLDEQFVNFLNLAICGFFGLEAQDLRRWSLERRGFREIGLTSGENIDDAELRFYLGRQVESTPSVSVRAPLLRPSVPEHEPLGLFNPPG